MGLVLTTYALHSEGGRGVQKGKKHVSRILRGEAWHGMECGEGSLSTAPPFRFR